MRKIVLLLAAGLGGCVAQSSAAPQTWYASHGAAPREGGGVSVCHGFGCQLRTTVWFGPADIAAMRRLIGRPATARAERAGIARMVAWAERRVAGEVGSAGDVAGMDISNAGRPGQMDCIDEATNTTSYLVVASDAGLLRFHRVGRPAARGFMLDLRYPHATATVLGSDGAFAIDSWPTANGALPDVIPLEEWFRQRRASHA